MNKVIRGGSSARVVEYSYRALLGPTDLRLEQVGLYRQLRLTSVLRFPHRALVGPVFLARALLLLGLGGRCGVSPPLGLRMSQPEVAHQST